jgi:hypothetical protein
MCYIKYGILFSVPVSGNKLIVMAQKENKGGILTNEKVEQDLKAKGKVTESKTGLLGSQDTGDSIVPQIGTEVQRNEGKGEENEKEDHT